MRDLMPNVTEATVTEATSIARRIRTLRRRTLRWFQPPIRTVVRDRSSSVARDARSADEN
jgi:hypothetical protein